MGSHTISVPKQVRGTVIIQFGKNILRVRAGDSFSLTDEEFETMQIQRMVKIGYLSVKSKKAPPIVTKEEITTEEKEMLTVNEHKTNISSWDGDKKVLLDKQESKEKTLEKVGCKEIELISTEQVFVDEKEVTEPEEKVSKKAKKTRKYAKKSNKKKKISARTKEKLENIKKEAGKSKKDEEIEFVDILQQEERIKSHPILKDI